ncbi:MAG: GNAT family N-acetyltransferase [Acidimicrobiales bacterium]
MEVTSVTSEETRPLRHLVLRSTQPVESTVYPGDDDPATRHFGAFDGGRLAGVASLYREARPGGPSPGWRLRGMATAPDARRQGAGRALLGACRDHVAAAGGGELWCNARRPAVPFYAAAGFEVVGDEFEVEGIGPHLVMRVDVPAGPPR